MARRVAELPPSTSSAENWLESWMEAHIKHHLAHLYVRSCVSIRSHQWLSRTIIPQAFFAHDSLIHLTDSGQCEWTTTNISEVVVYTASSNREKYSLVCQ